MHRNATGNLDAEAPRSRLAIAALCASLAGAAACDGAMCPALNSTVRRATFGLPAFCAARA